VRHISTESLIVKVFEDAVSMGRLRSVISEEDDHSWLA
jgi:hypothetical protein